MSELIDRLAYCVERGKVNRDSKYPPDLLGQDGASELCQMSLENDAAPDEILKNALMVGMRRVGDQFAEGKAFIPELLISAKAMSAALEHLKPYFDSGEVRRKGVVIIGTVAGDIHCLGKNIIGMVLQGSGWEVVNLGENVSSEQFLEAVQAHPGAIIAMSSLLTTTMGNMETTASMLKENVPDVPIYIGGAPVTQAFADKIGVTGYFPDPQSFSIHLDRVHGF